jgi:hypothetical protein
MVGLTTESGSSGDGSVDASLFERNRGGGQSVIFDHGSMGATETIDPTDGNVHTGTLNANVTYTLNAPSGSGACEIEFQRTGSGGPWTETWPGSVTWLGGSAPTPPTSGNTGIVILRSLDGGTTWLGIPVGSASLSYATPAIVLGSSAAAGAAATVIRSDATIAAFDATVPVTQAFSDAAATGSAAFAARRDHVHGMPATPSGGSAGHTHVADEVHLSDGSTTTYTLDAYYEPGSVMAFNRTTIALLLVTEVLPDQATVSAAGSAGDQIMFTYAATLV